MKNHPSDRRVALGLSGGIDSAVSVLLLQEAGYNVVGVTLAMHDAGACGGSDAIAAAAMVAAALGIEHRVVDARDSFRRHVLRPCWDTFASGRTPNPCVLCNPAVKFALLAQTADDCGAAKIATGHYARLLTEPDGTVQLLRGRDPVKDQTYFLHTLPAALRCRLLFPLGDFVKSDVRRLAQERGLPNAQRAESQDICFADGVTPFSELLRRTFDGTPRPGRFVDRQGHPVGIHAGLHLCTIGQRRGLGIALGKPAAVCRIDPATADITVSTDPADLLSDICQARNPIWHGTPPIPGTRCQAQIRYRQTPVDVTILTADATTLAVRFAVPVRAVTPGQSLVLYAGDLLLGGGQIV